MQVTKRDGRIVQFNINKIIKALELAFIDIDKELTNESKEKIGTNLILESMPHFKPCIELPYRKLIKKQQTWTVLQYK